MAKVRTLNGRWDQKWITLDSTLRNEKEFFASRLKPEVLKDLYYRGRLIVREPPEYDPAIVRTIYGCLARWPTTQECVDEVGIAWVDESHRGNGLLDDMLGELIHRLPAGHQAFAFSKNCAFISAAQRHGFVVTARESWTAEFNVHLWASRLGVVCRLPVSIHAQRAAIHPKERVLLIRQ
jgi:hypothetical protein